MGLKTIVTLHDHWGFCYKNTRLRNDASVCENFEDCYQCLDHFRTAEGLALPIRLRRDYVAWCVSQADKLVSPSRYLAKTYERADVGRGKVSFRTNGIELNRFEARPAKRQPVLRFTAIGYLGEHKGLKILMQAAAALSQRTDLEGKWSLDIVGGGHLDAWLTAELATSGKYSPSVAFRGKLPQDEIPNLLANTDVAVLSSIWPENEPVVMLEAIAMGIAQLATRHGGNLELVEDGASGTLVEPNDPDALVAAMAAYVTDPELAVRHGARNLERRGAYEEAATSSAYEADYADLLATSSPQSDEAVVIVSGGWPSLETTQFVNIMPTLLGTGCRVRLILEDWASPLAWSQAIAVWIWSDRPADSAVQRGLRASLPIVAPKYHAVANATEVVRGTALTYTDVVQAAAILTVLVRNRSGLKERMDGAPAIAAFLGQTAPASTFSFAADQIIV